MRYGILGPLQVTDDEGKALILGGRSERVLLACLLLEANRVVSSDRLIDALWGEEPPETAANAVQVHVSKLRKKLNGPSGSDGPLQTSSPGYVLRTAPGELDAERFETLATSTPADEEPAETSARLAEALSLWRGPVLAGLENDITAHSDIARLEGLRVSAKIRRIEADLSLGRHAQLVGELEGLIASDPLNEGLRRQLMVALYRSGRQAEALGVYRETREVLAEELGIDPSPALQNLELAVLNQSPELDAPVEQAHTSAGAKRPTGTVTFLFSDIEDSTALLRRIGEESYAQVLAHHHHLIRSALSAHEGSEVDTQGDAFFAVFSSSRACAASVVEMQQSFASHEWPGGEQIRLRMGIHAGEAIEGTTGLVGLDVHKAARIAAAAHGGQVLMSETAAALVRDFLPDGASLRDLGLHRLKDLGRPEQIFQLDIERLSAEFPPIRSLDNPEMENNLPSQLSSFVGREKELSEIAALVDTSRLVTLTGAGGSGKTRLALQVAAELLDGFGEGVWFVDLAPLSDPGLVATAVAQAVGVREEPGRPVGDTLVETLAGRHLLIVLDNCEHLIDACAKLTDALMRSCPRVHALATSRERLAIGGERVYRVPTLSLPDDDNDETAMDFEAVRLFLQRASEARADFMLSEQNAEAVVSICRRLDGIPLAIELAAARLGSMDIKDLDMRLDKRFSLLTTTSRTAAPRQQTLRALVDWSYDLLTELERSTLCQLSVFAGGWDLAAAEAVCAVEKTGIFEIADLLRSLVDQSLVQTAATAFGFRFGFLETIRQFAAEKLSLDEQDSLSAREGHARHFLSLAERAAPELIGPHQGEWFERLMAEKDNLRTALVHLVSNSQSEDALRLGIALYPVWIRRGLAAEVCDLFSEAIEESASAKPSFRARGMAVFANLLEHRGDISGANLHWAQGLRIAEDHHDWVAISLILRPQAWAQFRKGDYAAALLTNTRACEAARDGSDIHLEANIIADRGIFLAAIGDVSDARDVLLEGISRYRGLGDAYRVAIILTELAVLELDQGEAAVAHERLVEARRILTELHEPTLSISGNFAVAALLLDDIEDAVRVAKEGLTAYIRSGGSQHLPDFILDIALCASKLGDYTRAALLHGAADQFIETAGEKFWPLEGRLRERDHQKLKAALGEDVFSSTLSDGRALDREAAIEMALRIPIADGM